MLTVDCGVTAVEEVAHARAARARGRVTDHHRAGPELPDCPVVGPYRGDYPFAELCGTGVVWKLGQALLGAGSEALVRHLDLVAVATVADVVPLVDENRGLAVAGLRQLARTQKPGPAGADALGEGRPGHGGRGRDRLPASASAERSRAGSAAPRPRSSSC